VRYKRRSWKEIVDPAFDKFIKLYLEFLHKIHLPGSEGYLALELEEIDLRTMEVEHYPGIAFLYEKNKPEDAINDLGALLDFEVKKSDIELFQGIFKGRQAFFELLTGAIDELDEDSRKYYLKSFDFLSSEAKFITHYSDGDAEKKKKIRQSFVSAILSLLWQGVVIEADALRELIKVKKAHDNLKDRVRKRPRMLRRNIFVIWDTVSLLVHKQSMRGLFANAKNEKSEDRDQSLFKLMQVDKTIFDHDWVRERIRKAAYSGDWQFFDSLSKALRTDPLANRKLYREILLVSLAFWKSGLHMLTIPQLEQLYNDSGIRTDYTKFDFKKFIDRQIKPHFKDWLTVQK